MIDLVRHLTETLPPGTLIILVPASSPDVHAPKATPSAPVGSKDEVVALGVKETMAGPLTLTEWGRALPGISARELDRAHRAGALRTQLRTVGAGHGAIEASADAMIDYLQTCCAVQNSSLPVPDWWNEVRRGPNGRLHG
jgi:hypothetical protein